MIFCAENINFSFERGQPVISDFSLRIPEKFFCGLAGPNGSGKTTLLRLFAGALKPDSGKISIDGNDISAITAREKSKKIAVVPAEIFESGTFTAQDIVLMGRAADIGWWRGYLREDFAFARRTLEKLGLADIADKKMNCLSTGQRQKVFIAQALCQEPKLLVLDEPTSHLDLRAQGEIFALLKKLSDDGLTVITASHDINLLSQYCGTMAIIKQGKLRGFGAPQEIINAEIIKEVYNVSPLIFANPSSGMPFVNIPETGS